MTTGHVDQLRLAVHGEIEGDKAGTYPRFGDASQLIKLVRVVVWVPGSRVNQASILRNLRRQNTGVDTFYWSVYLCGEERTGQASAVGWTLAFEVPENDLRVLQAQQCEL